MLPRTVVIIMCFALKVTAEWAGSRFQVMRIGAPGMGLERSLTSQSYQR
jgi:hypothetical protein